MRLIRGMRLAIIADQALRSRRIRGLLRTVEGEVRRDCWRYTLTGAYGKPRMRNAVTPSWGCKASMKRQVSTASRVQLYCLHTPTFAVPQCTCRPPPMYISPRMPLQLGLVCFIKLGHSAEMRLESMHMDRNIIPHKSSPLAPTTMALTHFLRSDEAAVDRVPSGTCSTGRCRVRDLRDELPRLPYM